MTHSVIPFEPFHAAMLAGDFSGIQQCAALGLPHDAVTLWHNEREQALAAAGILTLWPAVGVAWFLTTEDAQRHRHAIARFAKYQLQPRLSQFRRIEAQVKAEAYDVRAFAAWLGFREVLYKAFFGPQGEDYVELAWTQEVGSGSSQ